MNSRICIGLAGRPPESKIPISKPEISINFAWRRIIGEVGGEEGVIRLELAVESASTPEAE